MKIPLSRKPAKRTLISIDKFNGGSNKLLDEGRMGKQFAFESNNMIQDQDAIWKTKWGSKYYGPAYEAEPDGGSEYVTSEGTTELIVIANGKAWKSTDGGTLTEITGATFTAGLACFFLQIGGYLYIANGTDPLTRYNGTELVQYTEIEAPENLTASLVASGLSSGVYTYYAEVTALNEVGETTGSTEFSIGVNKDRDTWTSATDKIHWSWDEVSGASRYQFYLADEMGDEVFVTSTTNTEFIDDGTTALNEFVIPPEQNTTGAPKFTSMCISENRIWATNNTEDMYKVYWSGTGQFLGVFSSFYGGGWINLERGGREIPMAVKHYQSGSGEGRATVLCKTPDGKGAVWQIGMSVATVGDVSFSVPNAVKVVGSFGTESSLGVVSTNNDLAFPNRKGWFFLGPEKNYYGILRTREMSSNIRPYWRSLRGDKISSIASYFYDAKIFIAVPTSSSGNDKIIIYDTERGNWAVDWSNSVKQFLEYTDTSGNSHFLYIPNGGTRLIELSPNFLGDLGSSFNQSYVSPLIPISEDNTSVFNLKEAIVQLGRPKGTIKFQILGIGKDDSFVTIGTATITNFGSNTGVGTDAPGENYLSETQASASGGADNWEIYLLDAPETFSQAKVSKGIKKKARLYAIQFKVFSTNADTSYSILNIQAKGTILPRKMPSSWTN
jgi:hypothetical protein